VTETTLFRSEPNQCTLAAGEQLFATGDVGHHMYAVIEGEIEIIRDGKRVEVIGASHIFGELALLDDEGHTRAADARATMPTTLAVIDQARFLSVVSFNPIFALRVMQHLADRIRRGW
jgi:CRP-like cAMP-binding protein